MTSPFQAARRELDAKGESRLRTGPGQRAFTARLRRNQTPAEATLWHCLRAKRIGWKIIRQRTILQYVVDFYCASTGLVIEVDGEYHLTPERIAYDKKRDAALRGLGLTVIRFANQQVLNHSEDVVAEIVALNAQIRVCRPLRHRWLRVNKKPIRIEIADEDQTEMSLRLRKMLQGAG